MSRAPLGAQLVLGRAEALIAHCARLLDRAVVQMTGDERDRVVSHGATLRQIANELRELRG